MVMPPAFTLEPRRRRASQAPPLPGPPERLSSASLAISYGAACERIDTATDREAIANALLDYGRGRVDVLIVFLIRDGNALGWRGHVGAGEIKTPIDELSLPLGGASAFQAAHDSGVAYIGPPPSAVRPVEAKLWAAIGAVPEPVDVVVVPVLVKQRAVNLIYAHVIGGPPPAQLGPELTDLANRAQTAYLRLIRQARGS
jgi:hypothetical protein